MKMAGSPPIKGAKGRIYRNQQMSTMNAGPDRSLDGLNSQFEQESHNVRFIREPSMINSTRGANVTEMGRDELSSHNFGFGPNS